MVLVLWICYWGRWDLQGEVALLERGPCFLPGFSSSQGCLWEHWNHKVAHGGECSQNKGALSPPGPREY